MAEIEAEQVQIAAAAAEKLAEQEKDKADTKAYERYRRVEEGRRKFGQLPKDDIRRQRAKAIEFVLHGVGEYRRTHKIKSAIQARIDYCEQVASGVVELPDWVELQMPKRTASAT